MNPAENSMNPAAEKIEGKSAGSRLTPGRAAGYTARTMRAKLASLGVGAAMLIAAIGSAGTASAETIMSTMPSTASSTMIARANIWYAYGFTTGSVGATLRSIQLDIDESQQAAQWMGSSVKLFASDGAGGIPGTLLATYDIYNLSSVTTFGSASSSYDLSASTSYWLAITGSLGNAYYNSTDSRTYSGDTLSGYQFNGSNLLANSGDGGESWITFTYNRTPLVKLSTDAVPEPSSIVLLGLGVTVALVFRRRLLRAA